MQAFVRLFYGIDGSHEQDFLSGCCCPCRTLRRVNDEMLYRDQPGPITDKLPSITSNIEQTGYLPNPVMVYPTALPPIVEEPREIGRLPS